MYLFFRIVSCHNVASKDLLNDSDVYCRLTFQDITKFTSVKHDTSNPVWAEEASFIFPYDPSKSSVVCIEVLDSDGFRSDIIEKVEIEVADVMWESRTVRKGCVEALYAQVNVCTERDITKLKTDAVDEAFSKLKSLVLRH